jgi:hypothetical protein
MFGIVLALSLSQAFASAEGIPANVLNNYDITGFSRPCCNFGLDVIPQRMGLAGVIDPSDLGSHTFARHDKKDKVGIAYSCGGGFVDVSHLRDNADWSAHIFWNLPNWLGKKISIPARNEGGFSRRSIFFPELSPAELAELTEDDLATIAVSAGWNMALLHEIPTSFNIAVSAPATLVVYETSSAFSVEDAYSNLLGNILGVQAARSSQPYNQAMETIINERLLGLGVLSAAGTHKAYDLTRDTWWTRGLLAGFGSTLKRDFTYAGDVTPFLIAEHPECAGAAPQPISIPSRLSNGRSPEDYYQIRGLMKRNLRRSLSRVGARVSSVLTEEEYPEVIEAIKRNFVRRLGEGITQP